jgi:peptidoglycan/xylan/chitin deacetylase (PgdA/CDA1 family)
VLHNRELVAEVHARGHTIGLHGWMHEPFHLLSRPDAERVIYDSLAAFRLLGIAPRGFRAPGGIRGPHCEDVLRKFEIEFDSSVDETASALQPDMLSSGIPNVPWQWPMIDYYQYFMHPDGEQSPEAVTAYYSRAVEDAARTGGYAAFIFHGFVSGVDEQRLQVLDGLFRKVLADDRLELIAVHDIAQRVLNGELTGKNQANAKAKA